MNGPLLEGPFLPRAHFELPQVVFLDVAPLGSAGLDSALQDSTFLGGQQALVMCYLWQHDVVLCPGPLQGRNTSGLETDPCLIKLAEKTNEKLPAVAMV